MTIRVPLRLCRQTRATPASALYVPSRAPAELLSICAAMNLDPSGRVFAVDGGFLVALPQPLVGCAPGAIRLKELCAGLYLPADGELVPALLEDEAAGVVRDRRLLFLQGGRVLAFDRGAAVEISDLLAAGARPRRGWGSLPEPKGPAERLTQIELERPDPDPQEIYREIRKEIKRPDRRSSASQTEEGQAEPLAGDTPGTGEDGELEREPGEAGAAGAGEPARPRPRNIRELAAAVRDWSRRLRQKKAKRDGDSPEQKDAGRADQKRDEDTPGRTSHVPGALQGAVQGILHPFGEAMFALREKLQWEWVDHSSLLKKLVREFKEGDTALALRRAIPIMRGGDSASPFVPVRANWLPWRRAVYSLGELLRRPGRGEAIPVRIARDQVIRELMEEYRKAAEQAIRQGDFRRAAYIFGVLLQDDRTAASALARGGLHHDAAVIYASKLNDRAAAAQAFEAAGEFDRALELYKQLGQHERAGDLLRRIGLEEAAVVEYLAAANELATRWANHLDAGRLLLEKARRPELAIEQFQTGWLKRPAGNSTQCGLELARLHSGKGEIDRFRQVLEEADVMFDSPGYPFDGYFYSEIVRMALEPALEAIAEEVRDRALQATARSLRRGLENRRAGGTMVSKWLGRSKLWPAALVSDADFAVAATARPPHEQSALPRDHFVSHSVQVGRGSVTAACQASVSGEILLGFEHGLICVYQPERQLAADLPGVSGAVVALSVDPHGQAIAAVYEFGDGLRLCCFSKRPDGSYLSRPEIPLGGAERTWLTPILPMGVERIVGVGKGPLLFVVDVASGLPRKRLRISADHGAGPLAGHLLPIGPGKTRSASPVTVLTHDDSEWVVLDTSDDRLYPTGCRWRPSETDVHRLRSVPISWRFAAPVLELAGVDRNGAVRAAEFYVDGGSVQLVASRVATTEAGYIGAAHAGSNTVVAVSPQGIDWLSFHGDRFRLSQKMQKAEPGFPSAVACFATHSRDAVVICSRGLVTRVPPPPRDRGTKNR
jgi:tetratricopeptide (TPR) repeat protein